MLPGEVSLRCKLLCKFFRNSDIKKSKIRTNVSILMCDKESPTLMQDTHKMLSELCEIR